MNDNYKQDDNRIEKILDSLNLLHTRIEVFNQRIEGEIEKELCAHHKTLYDQQNGLCRIVQIDHERVTTISKIVWAVGGAVVVLIVNAFGRIIIK
jgi:hypothetical protein